MIHPPRAGLKQLRCTRIAPSIIHLRSEAALPAARSHRSRFGLFAQRGIVRDGVCQGDDGLDVFCQGPIGDERVLSQMLSHERMLASLHRRASTAEAQVRVATEAVRNIILALRGETFYGGAL
jgi:hypothetical protein